MRFVELHPVWRVECRHQGHQWCSAAWWQSNTQLVGATTGPSDPAAVAVIGCGIEEEGDDPILRRGSHYAAGAVPHHRPSGRR